MKKFIFIFALFSLIAVNPAWSDGRCKTEDPFPYTSPYDMESCPEDIQNWIDRANSCTHFAGEEANDDERKNELAKKTEELKCNALFCDYEDIFLKYEGDIVYIGILTEYAEVLYGDTDVIKCEREKQK